MGLGKTACRPRMPGAPREGSRQEWILLHLPPGVKGGDSFPKDKRAQKSQSRLRTSFPGTPALGRNDTPCPQTSRDLHLNFLCRTLIPSLRTFPPLNTSRQQLEAACLKMFKVEAAGFLGRDSTPGSFIRGVQKPGRLYSVCLYRRVLLRPADPQPQHLN